MHEQMGTNVFQENFVYKNRWQARFAWYLVRVQSGSYCYKFIANSILFSLLFFFTHCPSLSMDFSHPSLTKKIMDFLFHVYTD